MNFKNNIKAKGLVTGLGGKAIPTTYIVGLVDFTTAEPDVAAEQGNVYVNTVAGNSSTTAQALLEGDVLISTGVRWRALADLKTEGTILVETATGTNYRLESDGVTWTAVAVEVLSTPIDASAANISIAFPTSTNGGKVLFYTNVNLDNNAAITVQSGDSLNGVENTGFPPPQFNFDAYPVGTQFRADEVDGGWVISVVGAPEDKDIPYARIELEANSAIAAGWNINTGMTVGMAAGQTIPSLLPMTRVKKVQGGMTATLSTPADWNDNDGVQQLVSTNTLSAITVPEDGEYRINALMPNVTNTSIDGGDSPLMTISVNGTDYYYSPIAGGEPSTFDLLLDLTAGDYVQIGFVVFNLDELESVEISPVIDWDDASLAGGFLDMVYGYLEVTKESKTEVVLAGMVEPVALAHGRLRQTVAQTYNNAGFDIDYTVQFDVSEDISGITADLANNQLVVTQAGRYDIKGAIRTDAGSFNASYFSRIAINDVVVAQSNAWDTSGDAAHGVLASIAVDLNVGDTIKLFIQANGTTSDRVTFPNGGLSVYLDVNQLPSATVVNPDALVPEDVKVLLGTGSVVDGSTLTISSSWGSLASTYERVEFQFTGTGGSPLIPYRMSKIVETANWVDDTAVVFLSDAVSFHRLTNMDAAGSTADVGIAAGDDSITQATINVYGIKGQKTVINTTDIPVQNQNLQVDGGFLKWNATAQAYEPFSDASGGRGYQLWEFGRITDTALNASRYIGQQSGTPDQWVDEGNTGVTYVGQTEGFNFPAGKYKIVYKSTNPFGTSLLLNQWRFGTLGAGDANGTFIRSLQTGTSWNSGNQTPYEFTFWIEAISSVNGGPWNSTAGVRDPGDSIVEIYKLD